MCGPMADTVACIGSSNHPRRSGVVRRTRPGEGRLAMQSYEMLKNLIEASADDVAKCVGGNKAAGTRVRKAMQDIKNAAQECRKEVLTMRGGD